MSSIETTVATDYHTPTPRGIWRRVARRIGKRYLAWRFRDFTPDSEPGRIVKVAGLRLYVLRGVFNPALHFTSAVLAKYARSVGVISRESRVLEVGTGSGLVAISAGLAGARAVVATDINPDAVRCAILNVRKYHLSEHITIRQGDMFESVRGKPFDIVFCNPPYFRGEPANMAERAFHAGKSLEWIERFGKDLHQCLAPGGSCVISLGDAADIAAILKILTACGWTCSEVARRDILVEVVYLFRLTRLLPERD